MVQTTHPLRRWRDAKRVTLADLARRVGVSPSHISEIERGINAPSLELAAKLSRETSVPIVDFVRSTGAAA